MGDFFSIGGTNVEKTYHTVNENDYSRHELVQNYDKRKYSYNPTSVFSPTTMFESLKVPDVAQDISTLKQLQVEADSTREYYTQNEPGATAIVGEPAGPGAPISIILIIAALVLAAIVIFKRR